MKKFGQWGESKGQRVSRKCWNCNHLTLQYVSFWHFDTDKSLDERQYLSFCPNCDAPFITDADGNPILQAKFGKEISNLPENIKEIYDEAGSCFSINAYKAAIMLLRTMLFYIAKDCGIKDCKDKGPNFEECVNFFKEENILPKNTKHLIDKVRINGNKANHEILNFSKEECEKFI